MGPAEHSMVPVASAHQSSTVQLVHTKVGHQTQEQNSILYDTTQYYVALRDIMCHCVGLLWIIVQE